MKGVIFNRLAQRELAEAVQHYESESQGLGNRFLEETFKALAILLRHPEAAPQIRGSVRRFVLPKFPYCLLYRPLGAGRLRILAVAHQKRNPQYWIGRQ